MMAPSTSIATRISSGLAGRLPDRFVGPAIRRVYSRVEPELARLDEFVPPGRTAIDVGAWYGPWTQRLTPIASSVVAVEPTEALAQHLRDAFPGVVVIEAAASDRPGTADLYVPDAGSAVGISSLEAGAGSAVPVRLVTIDSLDLSDVGFIKVDVEGHELPALRGAASTIQRDRPVLLVELEIRIQQIGPIVTLLESWGYTAFVLPDDGWTSLTGFDLAGHQQAAIGRVRQSFARRVVWPRPRYVNSVLFRPN
jgi:FkbM family methyltransferase